MWGPRSCWFLELCSDFQGNDDCSRLNISCLFGLWLPLEGNCMSINSLIGKGLNRKGRFSCSSVIWQLGIIIISFFFFFKFPFCFSAGNFLFPTWALWRSITIKHDQSGVNMVYRKIHTEKRWQCLRVTSGRPKEEGVEKREKGAMNCTHWIKHICLHIYLWHPAFFNENERERERE